MLELTSFANQVYSKLRDVSSLECRSQSCPLDSRTQNAFDNPAEEIPPKLGPEALLGCV